MNPFIKKELDKCLVAKPTQLFEDTFYVSKIINPTNSNDLEQHHFYMIEVADYIVNPYEGFTLHDNWNDGIKPTTKDMQVEVLQLMGKMVKVNALCSDGLIWSGWLPRKSITIKRVIA